MAFRKIIEELKWSSRRLLECRWGELTLRAAANGMRVGPPMGIAHGIFSFMPCILSDPANLQFLVFSHSRRITVPLHLDELTMLQAHRAREDTSEIFLGPGLAPTECLCIHHFSSVTVRRRTPSREYVRRSKNENDGRRHSRREGKTTMTLMIGRDAQTDTMVEVRDPRPRDFGANGRDPRSWDFGQLAEIPDLGISGKWPRNQAWGFWAIVSYKIF